MKKLLIQVGVVLALTGAAALPAHAEHQDPGFVPGIGRAIVQYNDGFGRYVWRDYRYYRDIRHGRKHKTDRCHQAQHIEAAAHKVEKRARHFDRVVVRFDGYGHISDDSRHLAEAAKHLHGLAHANRSSCGHLRQDYGNVVRLFNHFSSEFEEAHHIHNNHHIAEDWHEVEHAYHALVNSFDFSGPEKTYYGRHGRAVSPELIAQWRRVCAGGRRKSCNKLRAVGAPLP